MNPAPNGPKNRHNKNEFSAPSQPDAIPGRQGADDALAETNPHDSRLDEKVIVNTQSENKIVNAPSQTGAHPEGSNSVDAL